MDSVPREEVKHRILFKVAAPGGGDAATLVFDAPREEVGCITTGEPMGGKASPNELISVCRVSGDATDCRSGNAQIHQLTV